jgi:hypothetical protein
MATELDDWREDRVRLDDVVKINNWRMPNLRNTALLDCEKTCRRLGGEKSTAFCAEWADAEDTAHWI